MSSLTQTLNVPSLKNVLFATDFSECSQLALPYLRTLAERYGSTVHIFHALAAEPMLEVPLDIPQELDTDRNAALFKMKAMMDGKPLGDVPFTTTVKRGSPWRVLEELIEAKRIDLIVLGAHGRHGLKKLVLGSVSEQFFRLAKCPVLTIGPHAMDEVSADARFATILFATDFSIGSRHALLYAESLARTNNSHLIFLHAISTGEGVVSSSIFVEPNVLEVSAKLVRDAVVSAREQLAGMISDATMAELNPEMIAQCGAAAETIISVAKDKHANLIVIGAHRASASSLVTHFPWATASAVVCEAHCPVLTVRS